MIVDYFQKEVILNSDIPTNHLLDVHKEVKDNITSKIEYI